jgi:exosortase
VATTVSRAQLSLRGTPVSTILLVVGFATLVFPLIATLANQTWSREFGAYGPIVLVTGLWLLWRQAPELRAAGKPGSVWLTAPILASALVCYVFGYAYDFVTLEAAGVYGVGVAILQARVGMRPLIKHWFPLLYLAFAIPPPNAILADITAPLKSLVSGASTDWLAVFGLPVSREGVTIFVGQYQLLVEDACSGMNSLVGLIAVSLLYIYLMRGSSWFYSIFLVFFIIPIAIVANIIRIMTLILLTYYFGNEVAQGFLHFTAGMLLFTTALLCVFGLDRLLALVQSRFGKSG